MLTWVRSLDSLYNFKTIQDCNYLLCLHMFLLGGRLTLVSDFFPGERGRKKNKKVFRRSKKYFSKVRGFLSVHSFYKDLKTKNIIIQCLTL
jgi:hypothetical protein